MAKEKSYPLEQVIEVKKKRVTEAEKAHKEKQEQLKREEEKLQKVKEAKDKVQKHKDDKLSQMRQALDEGTTSDEIIGMKNYLKVVDQQLIEELQKVEAQEKVVKEKEKEVQEAKDLVKEKEKEVDKLKMHKEHWSQEYKKEIEKKEASEQDELGSMMYLSNKKKKEG